MAPPFNQSPFNDSLGLVGSGPIFGPGFRIVPPPSIFRINFSSDKTTLIFTVGDPPVSNTRRLKAAYRIYFAPIALASPAAIARPITAKGVFGQASMIGSTSAPENGGTTTISDTIPAGLDGWFFATAVNPFGVESEFAGPLRNH